MSRIIIILLIAVALNAKTNKLWIWSPVRKSKEQINFAYYCATQDVYHWEGSGMRTFYKMLKVCLVYHRISD